MSKHNQTTPTRRVAAIAGAAIALIAVLVFAAMGSAAASAVPSNTAPPSISGTPMEGQTLVATNGSWNGTEPITYTYQWSRCDADMSNCTAIDGATSNNYTLTSADVGKKVFVTVTATNADGSGTASSSPTDTVAPKGTGPKNTTAPGISGTPAVGQTLTASNGDWSGTTPITYAYQWLRCDASGGTCSDIAGATGQTYTVSSSDVGHTLRVRVTATNNEGATSAQSNATAVVGQPGSVSIKVSRPLAIVGGAVVLSGSVSSNQAGQHVTIVARPTGQPERRIELVTGTGGTWSLQVQPLIRTTYQATFGSSSSTAVTVGVRPRITFQKVARDRFLVVVLAAHSMAGKTIDLTRWYPGRGWLTVGHLRLGGIARTSTISVVTFTSRVPLGTKLRVFMRAPQAAPDYLDGFSNFVVK